MGFLGRLGGVKLTGAFRIPFINDDLIPEPDGDREDQNAVFIDKGFGKIAAGINDQTDSHNYSPLFIAV